MSEVRKDTYSPELEEQERWTHARASVIKSQAKRRGLEWDIHPWIVTRMLVQDCEYCGDQPRGGKKMNGLDRIDSEQGYFRENVVTCCWKCNRSKSTMELEEWLEHCHKVTVHMRAQIEGDEADFSQSVDKDKLR